MARPKISPATFVYGVNEQQCTAIGCLSRSLESTNKFLCSKPHHIELLEHLSPRLLRAYEPLTHQENGRPTGRDALASNVA